MTIHLLPVSFNSNLILYSFYSEYKLRYFIMSNDNLIRALEKVVGPKWFLRFPQYANPMHTVSP